MQRLEKSFLIWVSTPRQEISKAYEDTAREEYPLHVPCENDPSIHRKKQERRSPVDVLLGVYKGER